MTRRRERVLIVGVSTRAIAESADRAGFRVVTFDAFGDLDQPARAHSVALPRDLGIAYSAGGAVRAARDVACDAAAYVSNLENYPRAVAALADGRALWGNPPTVLKRVRNPLLVARALGRRGFAAPAVCTGVAGVAAHPSAGWLVKRRASGGGRGVRPWRPHMLIGRGHYLQERVIGVPGSVVFAADGVRAVPLGVSRQLIGERAFGARGFRYCGSILAGDDAPFGEALHDAVGALARVVTEEFGLVGVNGVDFVVRNGVPVAIEVNPRYSASMELVERAYGLSVFAVHARACAGALPAFDLARGRRRAPGVVGKAILFARRGARPAGTERWLADAGVRDVPRPGERIPRGRPVCTVLASGRDGAACRAALERRAGLLYAELEPGHPRQEHRQPAGGAA